MVEQICEKYGKQKVFMFIVTILIIINISIVLIIRFNTMNFMYENYKFTLVNSSFNNIEFKDIKGDKLSLEKGYEADSEGIVFYRYIMTYKNKYTIYKETSEGNIITFSDGKEYNEELIQFDIDSNEGFELGLVNKVLQIYNNSKNLTKNLFIGILLSIAMVFLGTFNLIYPEKAWELQHILDVEGGYPTEFAINSNKFVGVTLCIMSIIVLILSMY